MRLYTRTGATALDDPEFGHFDADAQGGFDLPDELSDRLHKFAFSGKPAWETDVQRQQRMLAEEQERRKDPATLLGVVEQLMRAPQQSAVPRMEPPASPATPSKRASKRAAAMPPAE